MIDGGSAAAASEAPLIIYGAGKWGYIHLGILRSRGWRPVGFCDADPNKWGTRCAGLPVMSVREVKSGYPGCRIHLAIAPPLRHEIGEALVRDGVVGREGIVNREPMRERVDCRFLSEELYVDDGSLLFCCSTGYTNPSPRVGWESDLG
ncbi:MAG: hypothetical protein LBU64_10180, partial [Planctomycetota bacterium]|nr:hypothetical protein [Planctomycetota bacterium]